VAATRMRRSKVNICIPPDGGARATPPDKDIAPTARMVAKWTLRRTRSVFHPRRCGQLILAPWRLLGPFEIRVVGEREDLR